MYALASFSKAEKDAMLPVIDIIMKCAETARREGVLALEECAQTQGNDFLAFAVALVVDGTDPMFVKALLETLISADGHTGSALLERIIITEGVLSIQAGDNPLLIETKLLACLGEDYLRERGFFPSFKAQAEIDQRISQLEWRGERNDFCEMVMRMPNAEIQQVFKEVQFEELSRAIAGCDEETARKLLMNISGRLALMVLDNSEFASIDGDAVTDVQEKITKVVRRLGYAGLQ